VHIVKGTIQGTIRVITLTTGIQIQITLIMDEMAIMLMVKVLCKVNHFLRHAAPHVLLLFVVAFFAT